MKKQKRGTLEDKDIKFKVSDLVYYRNHHRGKLDVLLAVILCGCQKDWVRIL